MFFTKTGLLLAHILFWFGMIGLVIAVMAVVGVDAVVKYQPLIEEHLGEVVAHLSVTNFLYTVLAGLALGTLSEMNDGSKRAYY